MAIRPDGTDNHWTEPEAPIGTGSATDTQAGDGWQLHPDWSPDGQQLAFVVDVYPSPNGGHRDIWVSDADGSHARQLYDCVAPCDTSEFPAWSKDGKSVMFAKWDLVDGVVDGSQLELVDVATGKVSTLAETHGADYFAYSRWSPDGKKVVTQVDTWSNTSVESVFVSSAIAVVDLTTHPVKITTIAEQAQYPDWHPSEDLIVFEKHSADYDHGPSDLYTMLADGGDSKLLVGHNFDPDLSLNATQPTWFPDGTGVTFVGVPGSDYSQAGMWAVDSDGSNVHPFPDIAGSHPRLRPLPTTP